jgi:hypothetical protein
MTQKSFPTSAPNALHAQVKKGSVRGVAEGTENACGERGVRGVMQVTGSVKGFKGIDANAVEIRGRL